MLSCAWLVASLPLVTWMTASVALVAALERSGRPGDAGALAEFGRGWRRSWRLTLPLGTAAVLALAALLANLLFLTGQQGAPAFLLLVGTLLLLTLWAMTMLTLVPTLVLLPGVPSREAVRVGLLLAFRHPVSTAGLVLGSVVLVTALGQVWVPLSALAAPVVGALALRSTRRHLRAVP